jgi:hypothetical protein
VSGRALPACLIVGVLACVPIRSQENPVPQTQESDAGASAELESRPEPSDTPFFLKTSIRGVFEQIRFDNGAVLERLRIRYLQSLGPRDAILGDFPLGRVDPGAGFSSAYGTGDLALTYAHLFGSPRSSVLQAAGAIAGLKTASNTQLGGHAGLLGGLYGIAWRGTPRIQPYVVTQYIHSVQENSESAIQSILQIRPVLTFGIKHGWFGTGESKIQRQLAQERQWGATLTATLGKQMRHWRTLGGYERAIGDTSQQIIYRSRAFLEFGYTF